MELHNGTAIHGSKSFRDAFIEFNKAQGGEVELGETNTNIVNEGK